MHRGISGGQKKRVTTGPNSFDYSHLFFTFGLSISDAHGDLYRHAHAVFQ